MTIEKLMEIKQHNDAPFNHDEYTVWLHNKIVDAINYELWSFREQQADKIKSTYAACNSIMSFESLKRI